MAGTSTTSLGTVPCRLAARKQEQARIRATQGESSVAHLGRRLRPLASLRDRNHGHSSSNSSRSGHG